LALAVEGTSSAALRLSCPVPFQRVLQIQRRRNQPRPSTDNPRRESP